MSDAMKSALNIETESEKKPQLAAAPIAYQQNMVQKASAAPKSKSNLH